MRHFTSLFILLTFIAIARGETTGTSDSTRLYNGDFTQTRLGSIPGGWRDLIDDRANPSWAVDGRGFLRTMLKGYEGLLIYEGALADGKPSAELSDALIEATFKKTPDPTVSLSIVGRFQDPANYYAARFTGLNELELVKVKAGESKSLVSAVTLRYCLDLSKTWRLTLAMQGDVLTARVIDDQGIEQARVDAKDPDFTKGPCGLRATEFASVTKFTIAALKPFEPKLSEQDVAAKNEKIAESAGVQDHAIVKPAAKIESLNTPFDKLAEKYDVIVAGGGTGGSAAAIQAARLGAKVLLVEESDWLGGQMSAAAVTTMDEEGLWFQFPVRERGIYREFHESMTNFYYTLDMDPFRAYASWPVQTEGGYEPKTSRGALYAFIDQARHLSQNSVLDVCTSTRIEKVQKDGEKITGVTLSNWTDDKQTSRPVACKVVIDATEYGDVLPLTGARYRVGTTISDHLDPKAVMQDNTWTAVIRDYPNGIPEHLKVKTPPPGYERIKKTFSKYQRSGLYIWGPPSKGVKGPRDWRVYFRWRGMADSDSSLTGMATEERHTECGLNGGNDYTMSVDMLEHPSTRLEGERAGIYLTLGIIYYFQNEVGVSWALAEDEGYNTPYNQRMMAARKLAPEYLPLAVHMPQWPYVRESRRGVGVYTLKAADMGRFENAKHWPTSLAMGDYFMDLHHSEEFLEKDLDPGSWANGDYAKGGGPFQVPFEVFIAEKVDGLVFAEKNISQSRLVNGATRLQPVTLLTGQAAGTIAALSSLKGVEPRALNPIDAQVALLKSGSALLPRWYADVPWGTENWRNSQLLSLYGILDRPAPIHKRNGRLREEWMWGGSEPVASADVDASIAKLAELTKKPAKEIQIDGALKMTRQQFAAACVKVLTTSH